MHEVRDVAGREPGEKRLIVESRDRVVDAVAEIADDRVRDVEPTLRDVVAATKAVDLKRVVLRPLGAGRFRGFGACTANREYRHRRDSDYEQRYPLPPIHHLLLQSEGIDDPKT